MGDPFTDSLIQLFFCLAALMAILLSLPFVGIMRAYGLSWITRAAIDIIIILVGFSMTRKFGLLLVCFGLSALLEGAALDLLSAVWSFLTGSVPTSA